MTYAGESLILGANVHLFLFCRSIFEGGESNCEQDSHKMSAVNKVTHCSNSFSLSAARNSRIFCFAAVF